MKNTYKKLYSITDERRGIVVKNILKKLNKSIELFREVCYDEKVERQNKH